MSSIKSPLGNMFLSVARNGDAFGRKPLSAVTVRTYEHSLKRAEELLNKNFEEWGYGDMEVFFKKAEEAGFRGTTTKSMSNVLRIMFRWAVEAGVYTKPNPMRGLPQVVREDAPPPVISPEKAREVLEAMRAVLSEKREAASELAQRIPSMDDRFVDKYVFLYEFSYFSGIPLKRLLNVKKEDVATDGVWETHSYGSKHTRVFVPVESEAMAKMQQYIDEHPLTDYVFYGESGPAHGGAFNKPLGSAQAYSVFHQARSACGFGDELTPAAWAESHAEWKKAQSS